MKEKSFLLTNDDGIRAEGLATAVGVAETFGKFLVTAPHTEQSGKSHSITKDEPLRLHKERGNIYSLTGTPADCVKFALYELMGDTKPDMVISGINHGANLGQDTIYSGTVAAAIEAAMNGLPAIALSLCGIPPYHFETAAAVLHRVITEFFSTLKGGKVLNVNIPNISIDGVKGMKFTTLGIRHYDKNFHKADNPRNIPYYWMGWTFGGFDDRVPETDCLAVDQGYVSLSILKPSLFDQSENAGFMTHRPLIGF